MSIIVMNQEEYDSELRDELLKLELISPASSSGYKALLNALTLKITDLINSDFSKLVQLLYHLDVSENKLRYLLKDNANSASIIAEAIIERQLQKIETRKAFKKTDNIADDERW